VIEDFVEKNLTVFEGSLSNVDPESATGDRTARRRASHIEPAKIAGARGPL